MAGHGLSRILETGNFRVLYSESQNIDTFTKFFRRPILPIGTIANNKIMGMKRDARQQCETENLPSAYDYPGPGRLRGGAVIPRPQRKARP